MDCLIRVHLVLLLVYVGLSRAAALSAQTSAEVAARDQEPPQELEQLASGVGVWDIISSYRPTPDAPVFNGRGVETVHLSPNGQFFVTDTHMLSPDGWKNELVITAWNQRKKEYWLLHVDNTGQTLEASMEVHGNTRTVLFYSHLGDRLVRNEMTVEFVSDVEYRFRSVCTDRDKTWVFCEGVGKKRK
jgi:hypothetical protein